MSNSMRDALVESFSPEFVVTVEALEGVDKKGLKVLAGEIAGRIFGRYGMLPPQEQDGKIVIFVTRGWAGGVLRQQ